jgi:hypothetical protein
MIAFAIAGIVGTSACSPMRARQGPCPRHLHDDGFPSRGVSALVAMR